MELYEANIILRSVKSAMYADGVKLPQAADADALMMLLDKTDCDKFLAPKIKHARTAQENSAAYKRAYCYMTFFRAIEAMKGSLPTPVTTASVIMLHSAVCGDLDADAGKFRSAEALTEASAHTDPKYIPGSLKSIIAKMNDIESAPGIGKEDFAGYLTHYMRELIILHPFERGSEFICRLFLMLFCKQKGFSLCYYRVPFAEIRDAEIEAFMTDDVSSLYKVLLECLSYEHAPAQNKRVTAQTRRELNSRVRKVSPSSPAQGDIASVKMKAMEQEKQKPKPDSKKSDDVLRRAIKLQQKITKLNEQLTELMKSSEREPAAQKRTPPPRPKRENADSKKPDTNSQGK